MKSGSSVHTNRDHLYTEVLGWVGWGGMVGWGGPYSNGFGGILHWVGVGWGGVGVGGLYSNVLGGWNGWAMFQRVSLGWVGVSDPIVSYLTISRIVSYLFITLPLDGACQIKPPLDYSTS